MAVISEPSQADITQWQAFLDRLPPELAKVAATLPPWELYRIKSTGKRATIDSFSAGPPISVCVLVSGQFNKIAFNQKVFGLAPDELEPCALPDPGEDLGTTVSAADFDAHIEAMKVKIRPDLWIMGDDGIAKRRSH